jgi:hypothetical protein
MADFSLSQPERRNFLVPIVIVLALAAVAFGLIYAFTPHRVAELSVTHTAILPTHTVFESKSIMVGARDQAEDDLYVVATVKIEDKLRLPIFIKDITGTLTTSDGAQVSASAAQKNDLQSIYTSFPKLKPMTSAPLLRETAIQPGQSAEGMVLLHFSVPQSAWDQRSGATITIDTYHQGPLTVDIPK